MNGGDGGRAWGATGWEGVGCDWAGRHVGTGAGVPWHCGYEVENTGDVARVAYGRRAHGDNTSGAFPQAYAIDIIVPGYLFPGIRGFRIAAHGIECIGADLPVMQMLADDYSKRGLAICARLASL